MVVTGKGAPCDPSLNTSPPPIGVICDGLLQPSMAAVYCRFCKTRGLGPMNHVSLKIPLEDAAFVRLVLLVFVMPNISHPPNAGYHIILFYVRPMDCHLLIQSAYLQDLGWAYTRMRQHLSTVTDSARIVNRTNPRIEPFLLVVFNYFVPFPLPGDP